MRLGFCSISALDRPLVEAARAAAGAGLDGIELSQRPPHFEEGDSPDKAREMLRAVRSTGLEVLAYGSYLGKTGERSSARAEREAAVAAALEAPLLRVWAEPQGEHPADDFAAAVALMKAAADAARPLGVTVVVERHVGSYADTPARIARLLDAVDRDNFALNYQVLDFLPPDQAERQPDDARELAGPSRYFHLKNYRRNDQAGGPLVPGGSLAGGVLDYRRILPAALDAGYTGPLVVEFLSWEPVPLEEKLAADVAFVRGLLDSRAGV